MNRVSKQKHLTITVEKGKQRFTVKSPLGGIGRFVIVVNDQFTNAPNTTQIASGAGKNSAAGNNAAIHSPNTYQQQSVGAGGIAKNLGLKDGKGHFSKDRSVKHHSKHAGKHIKHQKEVVLVINKQVVKLPKGSKNASATQIASGAGKSSTGGTNSAIESRSTRQQHAVGGGSGSKAINTDIKHRSRKFKGHEWKFRHDHRKKRRTY
ncbi:hypothetical protein AM231_26035 [Paenibacillus solani]|uniref:Uncharacterized protein n=1 Tax=Paenibacillus solani TaxID=1705565 RepID=A0A0M1N3C8_9BACL|nr:hypothetical protein AM231_26035 [Paenibacillus solani]